MESCIFTLLHEIQLIAIKCIIEISSGEELHATPSAADDFQGEIHFRFHVKNAKFKE
jgi:hypothetical protein